MEAPRVFLVDPWDDLAFESDTAPSAAVFNSCFNYSRLIPETKPDC